MYAYNKNICRTSFVSESLYRIPLVDVSILLYCVRARHLKKSFHYRYKANHASKYYLAFNFGICNPLTRVLCLPSLAVDRLLYTFLYWTFVIKLVWQLKSSLMIWKNKQVVNTFFNSKALFCPQIFPLKPVYHKKCKIWGEVF